jgi:hypothetical protein
MNRRFLAGFIAAVMLLSNIPAQACGDKLLTMARAIALYKAYKPWKSASILIYEANSKTALKDKQFQSSTSQAGHKVKAVKPTDLDKTLAAGKYDLVLAEIADAKDLKQRLSSRTAAPVVLPILLKPAKEEFAAAEKLYGVAIKTGGGYTDHLQAIDDMMKLIARKTI